jgi:hypothetical protein
VADLTLEAEARRYTARSGSTARWAGGGGAHGWRQSVVAGADSTRRAMFIPLGGTHGSRPRRSYHAGRLAARRGLSDGACGARAASASPQRRPADSRAIDPRPLRLARTGAAAKPMPPRTASPAGQPLGA